MYAPAKPDYPIAQPSNLLEHDAILVGISTRYGGLPAQLKASIEVFVECLWSADRRLKHRRRSGTLLDNCG